jgi:hypothetical protein
MNVCRLAAALFFLAAASFAQQTNPLPTTITIDGITYSNVSWRTVTPAEVSIFHQTGVATIPLSKLPPDLQQRFGYDPQRAVAYEAQETAVVQQRLLDAQARERVRQQREAQAAEAARKDQEVQAQADQARQQFAAAQLANANTELIQMLHVDGGINPLPTGGYVAQLSLSNQTTVCAHFDEAGRRYIEDAMRKYADWEAQQNSLAAGEQLQVTAQPGTIILLGNRTVRIPGGGYGMNFGPGGSSSTQPPTPQPVFPIYAVHEPNSSCYTLEGTHDAGQSATGLRQYSWQ